MSWQDNPFREALKMADDNWTYILYGSIAVILLILYLVFGGKIPWL